MNRSKVYSWLKSCFCFFAMLLMTFILLPEPAYALEANTLEAEIDGVSVVFYLEKAVVQDWGKLNATYVSYNPRGEKEYRLWISLPPSIEPGVYDFSEPGSNFTLSTQFYQSRNRWGVDYDTSYAKGSGSFAITERDDSWTHYTGMFDLSMHYTISYPNKTAQGSFDFTLGESFQMPEPAETNTTPSIEPTIPTTEPADDIPQTDFREQVASGKTEGSVGASNEFFPISEPSKSTPEPNSLLPVSSEGLSDDIPDDITPHAELDEPSENSRAGSYAESPPKPPLNASTGEEYNTYTETDPVELEGEEVDFKQKKIANFLSLVCYAGGALILAAVVVYIIRGAKREPS